jgi:hypothetical protein
LGHDGFSHHFGGGLHLRMEERRFGLGVGRQMSHQPNCETTHHGN